MTCNYVKKVGVRQQATIWGAYAKIIGVLRERITSGVLAPGAPVPSEATLCEEFTVVRNTIRRALAALEDEGLVETLPGKGRIVSGGTPAQCAYRRIATDLRGHIRSGRLAAGDILPSEAGIAAQYAVARGTARAALATLENEGLIEARHGKGRYVRLTPGPPSDVVGPPLNVIRPAPGVL